MDRDALTPAQLRVVDELMGLGQPRPTFEPDLPIELRDRLEDELGPLAGELGVGEVAANKRQLAQVHACEAHFQAERSTPFAWSVSTIKGTIAHKALELSVFAPDDPTPLDLVDRAIERVRDGDDSASAFLRQATPVELTELRAEANNRLALFLDTWPPLARAWIPCPELPVRVSLCDDRIVLRAKADLTLGAPRGQQARRLIVDFKTGRAYPGHVDDLRYYALLDTLRTGVPPFRVASYYLDSGSFHMEDVTLDTLDSAVRRVVDGVRAIVELHLGRRAPTVSPGPTCSWCVLAGTCAGAKEWADVRARAGLDEE